MKRRSIAMLLAGALCLGLAGCGGKGGAESSPEPGKYTPGTYTSSAQGFGGEVKVTMTFDANNITEVARWEENNYARDLLCAFIARGGWGTAAAGISEAYASAPVTRVAQPLTLTLSWVTGRQPTGRVLLSCAYPVQETAFAIFSGKAGARTAFSFAPRVA